MARTDLIADGLAEEYIDGLSLKQIANLHNASVTAVRDRLLSINVPMRERGLYHCNRVFFDDLSLEHPAYWLGFIFADGCIYIAPDRTKSLNIELHHSDVGHLEKFVKDIEYTGRIRPTTQSCVKVSITGPIVDKLMLCGVAPRKSKTMVFPNVPLVSMPYFLRGCFDGDGCIHTRHCGPNWHTTTLTYCSGSPDFTMAFRDTLCSLLPGISILPIKEQRGCFMATWSRRNDVTRITHLLYNKCTIALDRKLELALPLAARSIQLTLA